MDFSKKKLPKEAIENLYRFKIDAIKPFVLMLAPVYVLLRENQKFVSVKAPLDFFTENELKQLSPFQYFYFPEFIHSVQLFRDAGKKVRTLLEQLRPSDTASDSNSATNSDSRSSEGNSFLKALLKPSPFEVSNDILGIIGPLWWNYPGDGFGIQPFLITVFVNEVCDLLPAQKLLSSREKDVAAFDRALFRSSLAVFLALHLCYCNLKFINTLRNKIFDENTTGTVNSVIRNEIDELIQVTYEALDESNGQVLKGDFFKERMERVSQKIFFRLERVKEEFISDGANPPSIFGVRGFIDV